MNSENNIILKIHKKHEKHNYIANMLVRTLKSNDVNTNEYYDILKLFEEKVLGSNTVITNK